MPWAAALDEYSGATYYHNTETGESSWELPPDATFGAALDVRGNDWVDVGIAVPEAAQCLTSADGSSRAQRGATPGAAAGAPGQSGCGSAGSGSADSRLVREPHVGGLQLEHDPHITSAAPLSLELSALPSESASTSAATSLDSPIAMAAATARAAATRAALHPAALRAAAVLAVAEETARLAALPAAARSPPSFGRKTRFGGLSVPPRETERQRRQYKARRGPSSPLARVRGSRPFVPADRVPCCRRRRARWTSARRRSAAWTARRAA